MLDYWYRALKAKIGIRILTSNRVLFRQQLYRARAEAKNPKELGSIVIQFPEKEDELWMVKRDGEPSGRTFDQGDVEPLR